MSKRKKIAKRKTRDVGRSRPAGPGSRRRIRWAAGLGASVCLTVAGILVVRYVWQVDRQQQQTRPSQNLPQPPTQPPVTPEEEIAMLKNRELELAQQVMKDLPGSGDAYILTGDLHRRLGSSTKAVEFWQKGLQLHPNRADVYRNLGIVAMEKGDFEEAVSLWQKALEINPQMPGVHAAIARALMGLGRQDEAIKELEDDVRISPQSADSYFLLGQAFLQKQDYARAKMCYERAIELRPDHPNSYYGLSTACARLKEPDKAREYRAIFKKLRTARPEDREYGHAPSDDLARVRGNLADLSMRAAGLYQARGNTRRTEELLKQAVAADPNSTAPHKRLAALYRMTNRIPAALAQCERVRQLEPNDPTCHLLIATLALQLKRADRAEAAFRNFIALCPDQSVGYRELAHLYIRTNTRLSEAEKLAKKAVELEPTADNYFALGQACQKVGDKQGALAAMRKAVELAPDNREYKKVYDLIRYGR